MKKILNGILQSPIWLYKNLWSEPDPALVLLCMLLAVIIGAAAYYNYSPTPWQKIKAEPGLEVVQQFERLVRQHL